MNLKKTGGLETLFYKARALRPDISGVETGFETRVLARIRAERQRRVGLFDWAWRLVPAFSAVVVVLGIWYFAFAAPYSVDMQSAFTAETEVTLAQNLLQGE